MSLRALPADRSRPPGQAQPGRVAAAVDEATLLRMARSGHPGAGAAVYDRFGGDVNRLVWRLLGADEEHDDLVHQVFVAVLAGLARVREAEALHGWVVAVTVNTVRSEIRRRRVRRMFFGDDPAALDLAEAPAPSAEARELLRRTYAVLDRLPANERIVFALRHIDARSLAEVAAACDCSLATIKRRLSAAQQRFRRLAEREPGLAEHLHRWTGKENDAPA